MSGGAVTNRGNLSPSLAVVSVSSVARDEFKTGSEGAVKGSLPGFPGRPARLAVGRPGLTPRASPEGAAGQSLALNANRMRG